MILFELDGVLVDTSPRFMQALPSFPLPVLPGEGPLHVYVRPHALDLVRFFAEWDISWGVSSNVRASYAVNVVGALLRLARCEHARHRVHVFASDTFEGGARVRCKLPPGMHTLVTTTGDAAALKCVGIPPFEAGSRRAQLDCALLQFRLLFRQIL